MPAALVGRDLLSAGGGELGGYVMGEEAEGIVGAGGEYCGWLYLGRGFKGVSGIF